MKIFTKFALLLVIAAAGLLLYSGYTQSQQMPDNGSLVSVAVAKTGKAQKNQATAVFAMGCFWCAESDFEKLDGVLTVVSGYTGGTVKNPTYEQVSREKTGHYEAVLVTYDTRKLTYSDLLSVFWKNVDPFDANGQFCDKGSSYRAAIFPQDEKEMTAANKSKDRWAKFFGRDLAPMIIKRPTFYEAENYHQDYYKKNPIRYNYYRRGCGRDNRLKAIWGKVPAG